MNECMRRRPSRPPHRDLQLSYCALHVLLITLKDSAIADLHTVQFTVAHVLGFPVSTSRFLATDLNTEICTSDRYEIFTGWFLVLRLPVSISLLLVRVLLPLLFVTCNCFTHTIIVEERTLVHSKHITWPLPTSAWRHHEHGKQLYVFEVCLLSRCLAILWPSTLNIMLTETCYCSLTWSWRIRSTPSRLYGVYFL
jgi:hypothetical protein